MTLHASLLIVIEMWLDTALWEIGYPWMYAVVTERTG